MTASEQALQGVDFHKIKTPYRVAVRRKAGESDEDMIERLRVKARKIMPGQTWVIAIGGRAAEAKA